MGHKRSNLSHALVVTPLVGVLLFLAISRLTAQRYETYAHYTSEEGLSSNWVSCFVKDDRGFLWIGTQNGLNRFDGKNFVHFYNDSEDGNSLISNWVSALEKTPDGSLWIGSSGSGMQRLDAETQLFSRDFSIDGVQPVFVYNIIAEDQDLLVFSDQGVLFSSAPYQEFEYISELTITSVERLDSQIMICRSSEGLFLLDLFTKTIHPIPLTAFESMSRIDDSTMAFGMDAQVCVFRFSEGETTLLKCIDLEERLAENIWGVAPMQFHEDKLIYQTEEKFGYLDLLTGVNAQLIDLNKELEDVVTQTYLIDEVDGVFIGTDNGFIVLSDLAQTYDQESFLWHTQHSKETREIYVNDKGVWLGSKDGLKLIEEAGNIRLITEASVTAMTKAYQGHLIYATWTEDEANIHLLDAESEKRVDRFAVKARRVWDMFTAGDRVYFGGTYGLGYFDYKESKVVEIDTLASFPTSELVITDMLLSRDSSIWMATMSGIFQIIDGDFSRARRFIKDDENGLVTSIGIAVNEDVSGHVWIGTESGLCRYYEGVDSFRCWGREEGLRDTKVLAIESTADGRVWASTVAGGLFCFDPRSETFDQFDRTAGFPSSNFLLSASFRTGDTLYFGTEKELVAFDARSMRLPSKGKLPLYVDYVEVQRDGLLETIQLKESEELVLPHNYGNLQFQFETVNYLDHDGTNYAYRLDTSDPWIMLGNQPMLALVNLRPGSYHLEFKAENTFFTSSTWRSQIRVLRPLYSRWYAFLTYAIGVGCGLLFYAQYRKRKLLIEAEREKLTELDSLKSRLYSEISHELRTPLTIIRGNTKKLLENLPNEKSYLVKAIGRNTDDVLGLVNQMLDLINLDANQYKLNPQPVNLVSLLRQYVQFFEAQASSEEKRLIMDFESKELWMEVDPESLRKIVLNLVQNALKFTPRGGEIRVQQKFNPDQDVVEIVVKDSGVGISEQEIDRIFDRYYKTFDIDQNLGNGIGMALIKDLTHLMGGEVSVDSAVGKGATFTVNLPYKPIQVDSFILQPHHGIEYRSMADDLGAEKLPEKESQDEGARLTLMIVEDNADLRQYYKELLSSTYGLSFFSNGKDALIHLENNQVDFILSDIVMPGMDGFEFCGEVKKDWKTSHIPLIMVSGLQDQNTRNKAHRRGVDTILSKPFEDEELLLVISNLIRKRKENAEFYKKLYRHGSEREASTSDKLPPRDLEFIDQFQRIVLEDNSFNSIEELSTLLGMSRSQLYRKLKAITDMSATNYINHLRVSKAKELLERTELTSSEIAYEVGYSDPGYFGRVFKKNTKSTPQQWRDHAQTSHQ